MKIPFLMIAAVWSAAPATAAVISFSPNPATPSVGDVFTLDVLVTDVLDLYAFEFDLAFDPGVVRVNDTFAGGFLALGGATFFIPGVIDNAAGTVSFVADTLIGPDPGVDGSGVLARVEFRALAASLSSAVTLQNALLLDSGLGNIDAVAEVGSITVSGKFPEPVTVVLLSTGVVAVVLRARRRKKGERAAY